MLHTIDSTHVSLGSAETLVRKGGIINHRSIAYSLSNISAKNYPNRLMWVESIVCNISVVFWDTVYTCFRICIGVSVSHRGAVYTNNYFDFTHAFVHRLSFLTLEFIWDSFFTPPPVGGRSIVFKWFLSFFLSFFLYFVSATLRENGWTDLHEIFREGVEWPWDDLITFWVNSSKQVAPKTPKNPTMGSR